MYYSDYSEQDRQATKQNVMIIIPCPSLGVPIDTEVNGQQLVYVE